jgi:hypothetical protein
MNDDSAGESWLSAGGVDFSLVLRFCDSVAPLPPYFSRGRR